jgi:hypothetical protein
MNGQNNHVVVSVLIIQFWSANAAGENVGPMENEFKFSLS